MPHDVLLGPGKNLKLPRMRLRNATLRNGTKKHIIWMLKNPTLYMLKTTVT